MAGEHDRTAFHYGTEDINTAVLAADIGRYPAGMTLQVMLEDFVRRLDFIETIGCDTRLFSFTGDALLIVPRSSSLLADAMLIGPNFTMNAVISRPASVSLVADAALIENVNC